MAEAVTFELVEDDLDDQVRALGIDPALLRNNADGFATVEDVSEDAIGAVHVGHSLGGRLAAVASIESGNPAITFNAAGVSPATVAYMASEQGISTADMYTKLRYGQVREYSTADDPLTNIQQNYPTKAVAPDGVGSRIYLGGSNLNPKTAHEMPNVDTEMKNAYPGFYNP